MGFLGDVFEAIGDLAEILVEGGVELHQIVRDTGNDIAEATVQQVKNTLNGEGDKGIRTSYDIRDEAKERISKINREYRDTKDDFQQTWEKIKSYYYEVSKRRYRVYWMLGKAMHNTKLAALPNVNSLQIKRPSTPKIDSFTFELGTTLGSTSLRMEAAEAYEEESLEYEVKVKGIISELHQIKRRSLAFKYSLEEEDKMLKSIETSYLQQSEGVMEQTARILRSIANECLNTLNDTTQKRYNELLNQLRKLWK